MLRALGLVLLLLPGVTAGSADHPELVDPAGDVLVEDYVNGLEGPPLATGIADALDILAVWFTDDDLGLNSHLKVANLAAIDAALPVPLAGLFWIAIWSPAYANETGAAARDGTWELRAEYRPADAVTWHFWLERPCLDGNDRDGCAGADRDIVDGMIGTVDKATSTITITAPWAYLEGAAPGDGIHGLWATAQADWPTYPVRSVDWDVDQGDTCYRFTSAPGKDAPPAPSGSPPGNSPGRTGLPEAYAPSGCTNIHSPTQPTVAAIERTKESPTLVLGILLGGLLMLARRRR